MAASTSEVSYAVSINVLRNDRALVGRLDTSTVTIVTPPLHGRAWANPDGSVTYSRASKASGAGDTFQYTVRDDRGLTSNVATVAMLSDDAREQACWSTTRGQVLKGRLPATTREAGGPILYRLATEARRGTVTITDPTTGRFAYAPIRAIPEAADAFAYEVMGGAGTERRAATIVPRTRIMVLGGAAGVIGHETTPSQRFGFRQPLQKLLTAGGYSADFVGSQSFGANVRGFDADTEAHIGWTATELAYGKVGDGSDGIYAWLTANPAGVILLQVGLALARGGPYGVAAILDEVDRWAASPGGNPVTVAVAGLISSGAKADAFNQTLTTMIAGRPAANIRASNVIVIDHRQMLVYPDNFPNQSALNAARYRKMPQIWQETLVENDLLDKCPQDSAGP